MELSFDWKEAVSAFIVLFAMIDPIGLAPMVIDLQGKSGPIKAGRAALISLVTLLAFLFGGNMILQLFGVDIHSFAAAGAVVIFIMALEMILGVEIFRYNDGPKGMSTLVPVVFPLIAGAGTFTALLSLRAEYNIVNILVALLLNIIIVYLVLRYLYGLEHVFGKGGIYVLRKFFGIILLAIAVRLFTGNISFLVSGAQ